MNSDRRRLCIGMALLLFLGAPLAVRAQLSEQDLEAARSMVAGTLYLRLEVPLKCVWGVLLTSPEALLEVSPTGHDATRRLGLPMDHTREKIYWEFFPNYAVRHGELTFEGDTVKVWMHGVKPYKDLLAIDFVQIKTLDDFTKAFNQTFSKVPLQDEYPEWPVEMRKAVAEHRLLVGMTKEQAFDVVGTPLDIKTEEVNGVQVETWHPRQDKGKTWWGGFSEGGDNNTSSSGLVLGGTGFPTLLKFVDGKLQVVG